MPRRDDMTLDPEIERELAALDAALSGEPVDAEFADLAAFARAVREERPEPAPQFAAALDTRVAEDFPRPPRLADRAVAPLVRLRARGARRMLLPALGAAATVIVALVVVGSQIGGGGGESSSPPATRSAGSESATSSAPDVAEPAPPGGGGRLAAGQPRRVERQASLALETKASDIGDVADGVIRATDSVGGIVVTSSVSSGDQGQAGATFALRVPTARLDDALARLSKLAHVRSRTENSEDVTGAFVSAQERLDASLAERKGLLRQLARAGTPNETASVRARLRIVQGQIATARGQVRALRTRTDYSVVNVNVEPTSSNSGVTGGGGRWTPGDALHDAVRVLEVFAGVLLVGLAILVPLGLLGLAGGAGARGLRRRRREQALSAG